MKNIIIICFIFLCCNLYGQSSNNPYPPTRGTEFTGFFIGGMLYTEIYPKPFPIYQVNAGVSFKTKKGFLFDIVPIQCSFINQKVNYGASLLFRQYFKI